MTIMLTCWYVPTVMTESQCFSVAVNCLTVVTELLALATAMTVGKRCSVAVTIVAELLVYRYSYD